MKFNENLDVQMTRDRVPIIYHNFVIPDPESSSDIEVPIGEITLKQLKSLRAKKKVNRGARQRRSHSMTELTHNSPSNSPRQTVHSE